MVRMINMIALVAGLPPGDLLFSSMWGRVQPRRDLLKKSRQFTQSKTPVGVTTGGIANGESSEWRRDSRIFLNVPCMLSQDTVARYCADATVRVQKKAPGHAGGF